jgi:hypothetical protein
LKRSHETKVNERRHFGLRIHHMKTGSWILNVDWGALVNSLLCDDDLVTRTFDPVHDFYVSFLHSAFLLCYSHTFKLKKFFGHMRKREAEREEKSSYKKGQRWYIWYKVLICVRKSHSNSHTNAADETINLRTSWIDKMSMINCSHRRHGIHRMASGKMKLQSDKKSLEFRNKILSMNIKFKI